MYLVIYVYITVNILFKLILIEIVFIVFNLVLIGT